MFSGKRVIIALFIVISLMLSVSCGSKSTTDTNTTVKASTMVSAATASTNQIQSNQTPTTITDSATLTEKTVQQPTTSEESKNSSQLDKKPVHKVICIDPGHQIKINNKTEPLAPSSKEMKVQNPGGAQGVATGVPEYKLNLAVSEKLKNLLEQNGYTVVMTREINNVDLGNIARANIANECNADLYIRIHADGMDDSSVRGISVLIPGSQYINDKNILGNSKSAARKVLDGLVSETGAKSRGIVERNDLTGFNWAKVPMLLVEMGFMSNPEEDRLMNTDSYREKIAKGIYNGVNTYFNK